MPRSRKAEFMKAKTFLGRLQATVQSLPTEAEKAEARERIAAVVEFLETLETAIASMPSVEDASKVSETLAWIEDFFSKADSNPILTDRTPRSRVPREVKRRQPIPEQDLACAQEDLDSLKAMPLDDIRENLFDEDRYPHTRIRAIAANLGIGGIEKLSRESLVHQIATKIANFRGYQALSGKARDE